MKRNPIATLKNPFPSSRYGKKGEWLNVAEQARLKSHLDNSIFSKEILFYLMTGCRLEEAYTARINFEKGFVYVYRHKTEHRGVRESIIPISKRFSDLVKADWPQMFKLKPITLTHKISKFLTKIGIAEKSTHDLRHTFSTNLYYLGVDLKKHQYLLGHANIKMTYDTYTHMDPTVSRQDILDLWGDLYPEF